MKKKNQFSRSILLLIFMMFAQTALLAQTATPPAGAGTVESPYLIANLNNLYWITQNSAEWGKIYHQTADIDASATSGWDSYKGFSPIGNDYTSFSGGSYDGLGYSISGLYINRPSTMFIGLFGNITGATTLKNIVLKDVDIKGNYNTAALAGYNSGGLIDNCSTSGTVSGKDYNVGGLVGTHNNGVIKNSTSNCTVDGSFRFAGGLVGQNYAAIENSFASGNVTASTRFGGGFIGGNYGGPVKNCYSTGAVSGGSDIGGFMGVYGFGTITNCFWDTETSGQGSSAGGAGVTGKTTAQMKNKATYTGWDFTTTWAISNIYNNGYPNLDHISQPNGSGTPGDPYLIATINDLEWLSKNPTEWTNKHYKQTADIDASSTSTWDSGKGFSPIGNNSTKFSGSSYDGQGFSINGLTINRPGTDNVGLFGYTYVATTLKNIVLKDVNIEGNNNTAALAGRNLGGLIDNCGTSGTVKGLNFVGGLVGAHSAGVIKNSTSNCTVDGNLFAGGLVGQNYAAIENSFASGNVTTPSTGGGFIGGNYSGGTVQNCYATGAVSGGSDIGGFLGINYSGTFTNCFWDKETSNQTTSAGGAGVVGKTPPK
ncbi:MAG: hypothetical protein K8F24_02010 [Bacteroidales bacterium]|nr:hypothetical protein [Bacteroidales bacterium]